MSYNYIVDHIPRNTPHLRRPGDLLKGDLITIHNTGNPTSTARNERGWLTNLSNDRRASFHIAVDDREAVECIPLFERALHAGNSLGNATSIGIEICESGNYQQAVTNTVYLVAQLLQERDGGVEKLRRHWDWSAKVCPRLMYDGGRWTQWFEFKSRVAVLLAKEDEDEMKISDSERRMLVAAIKRLEAAKVITDSKWAQKAESGTLTNSELSWLNLIILSRQYSVH